LKRWRSGSAEIRTFGGHDGGQDGGQAKIARKGLIYRDKGGKGDKKFRVLK